ncbi:MAG: O-antigen ligase family protein [Rhodoferax sp.]|nr:O-antigen ligase family protein [Rhodoferax sp.]
MQNLPHPSESVARETTLDASHVNAPDQARNQKLAPTALLGITLFLVPALGVPSELMLQDTLKSALAAFGVLAAALLFFWQQRQRTRPLLWHGAMYLPLALMLYALASTAWSHAYLASVEAVRWFLLSLLLWLGLNTFTRHNLTTLAWGIHAGVVAASVWAALQFWLDLEFFPQGAIPASTFANRNFFAEYAVCALPFSVYVLANMRPSRWLGGAAISVALVIVAIMMTGTRSALIATLILFFLLTVILVRYRKQFAFSSWNHASKVLVGLVLITSIVGLGSVPSGNPKLLHETTGKSASQRSFLRTVSMLKGKEYAEGSFSIRAVMWKATSRMMMAHPLSGVGAGAWEVEIPLYQNSDTMLETDYYAHNEFLQLLSEYGIVVGGFFLAVLFAYLLLAAGTTLRLRGAELAEAPLRAIALSSLLALLIVSNAGFPWHLASCAVLLPLCLAILAGSDARLGNRQPLFARVLPWSPARSQVALTLLACCAVLATYLTLQAIRVEVKLIHAMQLVDSLRRPQQADMPLFADRKMQALNAAREGIAINPHYRKLSAEVAEPLAAGGDWENAVWILESIAASRPHVVAIWTGLAMGYANLSQHEKAQQALTNVQRLKPKAIASRTLEIFLLSRAGHDAEASRLLNAYFDRGEYDFDMVQNGYAIGYKTSDWALAIRSLELRNRTWPAQSADGYFRLGTLYAHPEVQDETKALAAFRAGLHAVPAEEKDNYRNQVPAPYRMRM